MLDKTVPYFNVIMKRRAGLPIAIHGLPADEFSIAEFVPGDEVPWASIETAVGEFLTEDEALTYFENTYQPYSDELARRCVFVRGADGGTVGTITSWWGTKDNRRAPSIHWLAVRPDYQGLGLGKVLVAECLKRLVWLEGDRDIFLHTQTWSHRAIAIYLKAGFEFVRQGSFDGYPNDYDQAMPVLRTVLPSLEGESAQNVALQSRIGIHPSCQSGQHGISDSESGLNAVEYRQGHAESIHGYDTADLDESNGQRSRWVNSLTFLLLRWVNYLAAFDRRHWLADPGFVLAPPGQRS